MRVLGVDPGSLVTGWGLLEGSVERPRIAGSGAIRINRAVPFAIRLARLARDMGDVVDRFRPDVACVESPFHGPNARAALQLAHARGVVLARLGEAGVHVAEYSPATIKKAITGTGKADKEQVQAMVRRLLGNPADESRDVSDALAVAYCHLASSGFTDASRRVGRGGSRTGSRVRRQA